MLILSKRVNREQVKESDDAFEKYKTIEENWI